MSTEQAQRILVADPGEAGYLAGLVAAAFFPLDPAVWQIGDEDLRRAAYPGYFQDYLGHAFEHGVVEMLEDRSALAAWVFQPGTEPGEPEPPAPHVAAMLGPVWTERLFEFDRLLTAALPRPGRAFEHLAILATRPALQGKGLGSTLLAHRLAHLDETGTPGYLEASGADTRRVYLKFGFEDHGEPIRLPGTGACEMFPMWRDPR